MSKKRIRVKSSNGYKYYIYNQSDKTLYNYDAGIFGGYNGKAGSGSSLSDAIDLAKALTGGANHEIEITDFD